MNKHITDGFDDAAADAAIKQLKLESTQRLHASIFNICASISTRHEAAIGAAMRKWAIYHGHRKGFPRGDADHDGERVRRRYRMMEFLAQNGPATTDEIAAHMRFTRSQVNTITGPCRAAEQIISETVTIGGQGRYVYSITDAGRAALADPARQWGNVNATKSAPEQIRALVVESLRVGPRTSIDLRRICNATPAALANALRTLQNRGHMETLEVSGGTALYGLTATGLAATGALS